jgi:hypothetical protein
MSCNSESASFNVAATSSTSVFTYVWINAEFSLFMPESNTVYFEFLISRQTTFFLWHDSTLQLIYSCSSCHGLQPSEDQLVQLCLKTALTN